MLPIAQARRNLRIAPAPRRAAVRAADEPAVAGDRIQEPGRRRNQRSDVRSRRLDALPLLATVGAREKRIVTRGIDVLRLTRIVRDAVDGNLKPAGIAPAAKAVHGAAYAF